MSYQYLYGFNPILAALGANKRKFYKLMVSEPIIEKTKILDLAKEMNIKIEITEKTHIEKFAFNKPHQGLVLKATELLPTPISDVKELNVTGNESQL